MQLPPRSILVINIRLIGDVILTTPLIALLRDAYPEAVIDLLVKRGTGEFLEKDPRIRRVLYVEPNSDGESSSGYLFQILNRYDLAITMNTSDRVLVAAMAASRRRVGFCYLGSKQWKHRWKEWFLTIPLPFYFAIHAARLSQQVAEALGIHVPRLEVKVFWDTDDEQIVARLLGDKRERRPYFVVHPFARWRYKFWNMDSFAMVSDQIAYQYNWDPVWTSSPDPTEIALLKDAASRCRVKPLLILGELSLSQMNCLLASAKFYLGLDTAITHLAASVGIPLVALYGPTIAERWSPWNNDGPVVQQCPLPRGIQRTGNIILIQGERHCIPCGLAGCDDNGKESPCIQEISSEQVLTAVNELLGLSQGGSL